MVGGGKTDDGARRWGQAVVLHHTFGLKEADPPSLHTSLEYHVWSCMIPSPTCHHYSVLLSPILIMRLKKGDGGKGKGIRLWLQEERRRTSCSFFLFPWPLLCPCLSTLSS